MYRTQDFSWKLEAVSRYSMRYTLEWIEKIDRSTNLLEYSGIHIDIQIKNRICNRFSYVVIPFSASKKLTLAWITKRLKTYGDAVSFRNMLHICPSCNIMVVLKKNARVVETDSGRSNTRVQSNEFKNVGHRFWIWIFALDLRNDFRTPRNSFLVNPSPLDLDMTKSWWKISSPWFCICSDHSLPSTSNLEMKFRKRCEVEFTASCCITDSYGNGAIFKWFKIMSEKILSNSCELERLRNECNRIVSKGDRGGHVGLGLHMRIQNSLFFNSRNSEYVIIYARAYLFKHFTCFVQKKRASAHLEKLGHATRINSKASRDPKAFTLRYPSFHCS